VDSFAFIHWFLFSPSVAFSLPVAAGKREGEALSGHFATVEIKKWRNSPYKNKEVILDPGSARLLNHQGTKTPR
jgi:hypothetical protein